MVKCIGDFRRIIIMEIKKITTTLPELDVKGEWIQFCNADCVRFDGYALGSCDMLIDAYNSPNE